MYYVPQNSKNHVNYNAPFLPSIRFTVGFCSALLSLTIVAAMAAPRCEDVEQNERIHHRISVFDALMNVNSDAESQKFDQPHVDSSETYKNKFLPQL